MPSFFAPHRAAVFAAAFALAGGITSCNEALDPCRCATKVGDLMDGTYLLKTVDGSAIPPTGYVFPNGAGKLLRGELEFSTLRIENGKCDSPDESSGEVIALYECVKADGTKLLEPSTGSTSPVARASESASSRQSDK